MHNFAKKSISFGSQTTHLYRFFYSSAPFGIYCYTTSYIAGTMPNFGILSGKIVIYYDIMNYKLFSHIFHPEYANLYDILHKMVYNAV